MRKNGPLVRVVAFHDIPNREWFETLIERLLDEYTFITPEQFHKKEFNTGQINILCTFDDGYQSWIDTVLPVFKKYHLKGLFFVNSGLIDSPNTDAYMQEQLRITPKPALTWSGVKTLLEHGHSIGGHSKTHLDLATLNGDILQKEIEDDKKRIEENIDEKIIDFAYPFGRRYHYSTEVTAAVTSIGYTYAYTAESNFASVETLLTVPRTLIEKEQSKESVVRWINGGYDLFSRLKS
jgi:peptidoglycan/xylan/chitin deacetylase (PgdA/CDA1 family)